MAPHFLSQGKPPAFPAPSPQRGAHMRLLGGILRPSRNQVTCGRGKLAMRGARMTAASPWETLWRFSPSSKLPMSAGGRALSGSGCPAPGLGVVAAGGKWGADRMTIGEGDTTLRPPA